MLHVSRKAPHGPEKLVEDLDCFLVRNLSTMGRLKGGWITLPDFSDDAWLKRGSITLPECNPMQWEGVTRMEDSRGQVIIVGAGVSGLTAGYLLARKGFKIVVIEKEDRVGGSGEKFLLQ